MNNRRQFIKKSFLAGILGIFVPSLIGKNITEKYHTNIYEVKTICLNDLTKNIEIDFKYQGLPQLKIGGIITITDKRNNKIFICKIIKHDKLV